MPDTDDKGAIPCNVTVSGSKSAQGTEFLERGIDNGIT